VALALRPHSVSWVNLAWSSLAGRVALDLFRPAGDLVRSRKNLPRRHFRDYAAAAGRTPTLLAVSPNVVPPAADWPPALRQTGYWVRDDAGGGSVDPLLEEFLTAGAPPVFVGFGSMPTPDPDGVVRDVSDVLRRLGVRGVVGAGIAGLSVERSPELLGIAHAPHDLLFPRCAVVVHHGGAGTTAAAVRAGVPQVVVPHAADQPYWGRRMADLGVAAPPIARKDLTAAGLERALEVALSRQTREAAHALGERVRVEEGAGDAARLVHAYLSAQGPPRRGHRAR
jgi:sterol 3beta-glucosyltransferase